MQPDPTSNPKLCSPSQLRAYLARWPGIEKPTWANICRFLKEQGCKGTNGGELYPQLLIKTCERMDLTLSDLKLMMRETCRVNLDRPILEETLTVRSIKQGAMMWSCTFVPSTVDFGQFLTTSELPADDDKPWTHNNVQAAVKAAGYSSIRDLLEAQGWTPNRQRTAHELGDIRLAIIKANVARQLDEGIDLGGLSIDQQVRDLVRYHEAIGMSLTWAEVTARYLVAPIEAAAKAEVYAFLKEKREAHRPSTTLDANSQEEWAEHRDLGSIGMLGFPEAFDQA